jgi:serine/threonine-protein kinase
MEPALTAAEIPPIGSELGRYRLLRRVGEGARGVVFEADDPAFDRSVAIKVLKPEFAEDEAAIAEFRQEAETTARVHHENVVSILAVGEQDGHWYTVMEFVDGESLDRRLADGKPMPWPEAVGIGLQVGQALREAHAMDLLHRDVKPDNILMYQDGRARLTDFGIVKDISSLKGFLLTGRAVGTAAYASPEQCLGKRLLPTTDIYSLGATLYRMVTGRFPFPGKTNKELMTGHVKGRLAPPVEHVPDLPRPLSNAIVRMMARNPGERYASIDRVLADLTMIRDGKTVVAPAAKPAGPVRIERRRNGRATERVAARRGRTPIGLWITIGIVVVGAIVALVALL